MEGDKQIDYNDVIRDAVCSGGLRIELVSLLSGTWHTESHWLSPAVFVSDLH